MIFSSLSLLIFKSSTASLCIVSFLFFLYTAVHGWNLLEPVLGSYARRWCRFLHIFFLMSASSLRLREAVGGVAIEGASLWHGQSSIPRRTGREGFRKLTETLLDGSIRRGILTVRPHRGIDLPRVAATPEISFPRSMGKTVRVITV